MLLPMLRKVVLPFPHDTPITHEYAYFQSSGFSPKMAPVIEETNRWAQFQSTGGTAPLTHEKMLQGLEAIRKKVA